MPRGGAGLIAAVLALSGCKSTDPKPPDRDPAGVGTSRPKAKDTKEPRGPTWLDPTAKLPGVGTGIPKAGSWAGDPKSPNFDAKAEAQDALGGRVLDTFNRPARNVFIRVEPVDGPPGTGAMGVYADQNGYFLARGLKPGKAYNLTAEATQEGKVLTGSVQTKVPNPVLTLVLRDDLGLPPVGKASGPGGNAAFPPPPTPADGDPLPPSGGGPGNPPKPPADGAWTPGGGATRPVPAAIPGSPAPAKPTPTPGGGLPPPDDLSAPPRPNRPENIADGPKGPFTPPTVNIPGPPVPALPPSYPVPPPTPPSPGQSRVRSGANFSLVDTLERPWDFATSKSGSVVLVEFLTTTCEPCKRAAPILGDFQSRFAADGLQVIGVACDDLPLKARAAATGKYARDHNLNYALFVEPGATAGTVRDRFGVESYPTAVLLDATGTVLWKGHPSVKKAELEAAIRQALRK